MEKISGFTFIHNALKGGYPVFEAMAVVLPHVDEMVVVDMQSDDDTRELLDYVARQYTEKEIKVVDGEWWPGKAGRCLSYNHSLHGQHCSHRLIWHFEADEVFGQDLASRVWTYIANGYTDLAVMRIQLEQNFQRVRWYPEAVHRIFPKGTVSKSGHTTNRHKDARVIPIEDGLLWDITNCFLENWDGRVHQQAELWGEDPNRLYVPLHIGHSHDARTFTEYTDMLDAPHWTWKACPFWLPPTLHDHVGKTRYAPQFEWLGVDYPWPEKM